MWHLDFNRVVACAYDQIESTIDRYRMNFNEHLARSGSGIRNIFQVQNVGAAEFYENDSFHLSSLSVSQLFKLMAQGLKEAALFQLIVNSGVHELFGFAPPCFWIRLGSLCENGLDCLVRQPRRSFDKICGVLVR